MPRSIEVPFVIAIVLIAIIFRFAQFNQVPPGLHYDEAIDAKLAQEIRAGATPLYFEEGWGREPLYHYLVAFTLNFTPDPTAALRLTSALLGLIQLLAAYALFRSLFGVPMALIGAAWIAVLFWTVSTSRAGLRNITLTTLTTLTAWAFWRAWRNVDRSRFTHHASRTTHYLSFVLAGLLLGLTLYTYQPSRVVPLIYLVFVGFLALRQRALIKQNWRALVLFFSVAVIIALPLIVFLTTHPQAETARAFQTEPIRALLSGNLQPVIDTTVATLKMFTFDGAGDPQILYNISGRPIFIGLGSILFYVGLLVSVWRWKQPTYAFMLIWLAITLLPNMLTAPAPFFYRAIAAQTPVAVMPAIGTVALGQLFQRANQRKGKIFAAGAVVAIALVSLGQTAITTWHDYFEVWGRNAEVRFQYSAALTDIAHTIDASPDTSPVAVSSDFIEDADPIIFAETLNRHDLDIRWFDARESLVAVAGASVQRVALPSFTPLADELKSRFPLTVITATKDLNLYAFDAVQFRSAIEAWRNCAGCPVAFDQNIALLGIDRPDSVTQTAGLLTILSAWRVLREGQASSTAIFLHLLDVNGQLATQDANHLGVPRHTWQIGDEFVQVHNLPLAGVSPGTYTLELGIYTRDGETRWSAVDRSGSALGDRVLLGQIEVLP